MYICVYVYVHLYLVTFYQNICDQIPNQTSNTEF